MLQAKSKVKYGINEMKWRDIFDGAMPKFAESKARKIPSSSKITLTVKINWSRHLMFRVRWPARRGGGEADQLIMRLAVVLAELLDEETGRFSSISSALKNKRHRKKGIGRQQ